MIIIIVLWARLLIPGSEQTIAGWELGVFSILREEEGRLHPLHNPIRVHSGTNQQKYWRTW
jgi:hypothetical protein